MAKKVIMSVTIGAILALAAIVSIPATTGNAAYAHGGGGNQGCTPGFWKNHQELFPISGDRTLNQVFGTNLPDELNLTLEQALNAGGGGIKALARAAVAALFNSLTIESKYSDNSVVNFFRDALDPQYGQYLNTHGAEIADDNDLEHIKDKLDAANNLGCPL